MTGNAISFPVKKCPSIRSIAHQQFFQRILGGDALVDGRSDFSLRVQELGDAADLGIGKLESRHALFGAAVANDRPNQVSINIMADQGRMEEIRSICSSTCIQAMTEAASLPELRFTGGDVRRFRRLLTCGVVRVLRKH